MMSKESTKLFLWKQNKLTNEEKSKANENSTKNFYKVPNNRCLGRLPPCAYSNDLRSSKPMNVRLSHQVLASPTAFIYLIWQWKISFPVSLGC